MLSKELVSKSQSEKCQFHIFPWPKFIFRNNSLLQSKNIFGISCCHGNYNQNKVIHILSCCKEIVCFEYALFVEYAIFVKSLMVGCFGCHGNMY